MLLDTDIVIEIFKGNSLVRDRLKNEKSLKISAITVMELYYGAFNKMELAQIKKGLQPFFVESIIASISDKAIELIEKYSKSHNLAIPDALIAATAIIIDEPLYSLNTKDFRFINGLELIN